ncbi:MAG: magnesium chelatase [Bacilli bacterium]|nr:magnesium chelatase [Bacilli bacterium]
MDETSQSDSHILHAIRQNLASCIYGKQPEIELVLTALLAEGHILLKDVPGTGKTVLVKALAKSLSCQFRRIQCNPDLLPGDITGVSIYHPPSDTFVFRPGPVMTHLLLVDEINRATTKTQSALLEVMEEQQVTADGESFPLPSPFLLFATQNPIDFEGTYSLPEAQLDRFMLNFSLGYPDAALEKKMVISQSKLHPLDQLTQVATTEQILQLQNKVKDIYLDDAVAEYLVRMVRATREHPDLQLGASPRASLALVHAVKAYAFLQQRDFVLPDDIKYLSPFVLCHRLILTAEARMQNKTSKSVLQSISQQLSVPV